MKRHARKILASAFITVVGLGMLAGARPAEPKPDRLTVEGHAGGQLRIRHATPDGKTLDLRIDRLADGRYRVTMGNKVNATCEGFQLADDGRFYLSGDVELQGDGIDLKGDRVSIDPERSRSNP